VAIQKYFIVYWIASDALAMAESRRNQGFQTTFLTFDIPSDLIVAVSIPLFDRFNINRSSLKPALKKQA